MTNGMLELLKLRNNSGRRNPSACFIMMFAFKGGPMTDIETTIQKEYAKFFEQHDWFKFRQIAEYYLREAVFLQTDHINNRILKLLIRNIQKRLFIGVACELLLKALYLKSGYCINRPRKGISAAWPHKFSEINRDDFSAEHTYEFNYLIDHLKDICTFSQTNEVIKGLKIAKVFRNKEAHTVVYWHEFDPDDYSAIETCLSALYQEGFSKKLDIQFSVAKNEKGVFQLG
jgi:hypothetical protein